jgi:hypothetical protein
MCYLINIKYVIFNRYVCIVYVYIKKFKIAKKYRENLIIDKLI